MEANCSVDLSSEGIVSSYPITSAVSTDGDLIIRESDARRRQEKTEYKVNVCMDVTEIMCKGIGKLRITSTGVLSRDRVSVEMTGASELELTCLHRFKSLDILTRGTAQARLGCAIARRVHIAATAHSGVTHFCAVDQCNVLASGYASIQGQAGYDCLVRVDRRSALSAIDVSVCSPPSSPVKKVN